MPFEDGQSAGVFLPSARVSPWGMGLCMGSEKISVIRTLQNPRISKAHTAVVANRVLANLHSIIQRIFLYGKEIEGHGFGPELKGTNPGQHILPCAWAWPNVQNSTAASLVAEADRDSLRAVRGGREEAEWGAARIANRWGGSDSAETCEK